jgi:lipoyl(octanoyl) transferase
MIDSMRNSLSLLANRRPAAEVFLLGQVDFDACLALQRRLVSDSASRAAGNISLLVCEHPPIITIGRSGSRDDVRVRGALLAGRTIELVEVDRGGGTMLHLPGQLAIYPIVPLDWYGWTVGEYLHRLQAGLLRALGELGITGELRPGRHGIWGRSGQLISVGVAVTDWIAYYGALLNVVPTLPIYDYIDTDPVEHTPAGSICQEHRKPVHMTAVRSRVVRAVVEALGCEQFFAYAGHPLLTHAGRLVHDAALAS